MKIKDKRTPKSQVLKRGDVFTNKNTEVRMVIYTNSRYKAIDLENGIVCTTSDCLKDLTNTYLAIWGKSFEIITDKVELVIGGSAEELN